MGSEYDNSYGWAFTEINRSVSIWDGFEFQYEDDSTSRMHEKFKLRSRCEIRFSFTSAEGEVQYEDGVVMCRDVIGTGKLEVFDLLKRPKSMVMCTPCSNSLIRPVRHQKEPCPLEKAGTSLDAEVDAAIQPGKGRLQGMQRDRQYLEALSKATHIVNFLIYYTLCASVSSPHSNHRTMGRSPAKFQAALAGTSKVQAAPTSTWRTSMASRNSVSTCTPLQRRSRRRSRGRSRQRHLPKKALRA